MSEHVLIHPRFNGPPDSGHGGYVCGTVAGLVGGTAQVTLRRPPPLDHRLVVRRLDGGGVELRDGEALVAHGIPTSVALDVPEAVSLEEAEEAARSYFGFQDHVFPTCFACGPRRAPGDGLRIFPGVVPGRNLVAAPWVPDASLLDPDDRVRPEFVWAALDCPGGVAIISLVGDKMILLGQMSARLLAPVARAERCVVVGWPGGAEGRKRYAGVALFSATRELRAVAAQIWITRAPGGETPPVAVPGILRSVRAL